jgi:aminoglycoside phosphotransferase (APT) family kinase protein
MLAYWSEPSDDEILVAARMMPPVTAAPGFPTRAQAVARYAAQTGFDVSDIDWYQAFAYFKLAIICQGIALRAAGGSMLGSGFDTAEAMVEPLARAGLHVL